MEDKIKPNEPGQASPLADAEHGGAKHETAPHGHAEHGGHDSGKAGCCCCCCCCPDHESGHRCADAAFNAWPEVPHDQLTFAEPARFGVPTDVLNRVSAFTRTMHLRDQLSLIGDEPGRERAHAFGSVRTEVPLEAPVFRDSTRLLSARDSATAINRSFVSLLRAKPRKNQAVLSDAERRDFNQAVSMAIDAGQWAWFTNIHQGRYMMHSFMNPPFPAPPLGTYRFLPWHRVYLYRMEVWLNFFVHGVTIPYWDWANDRTLPPWVLLPPGITRGPDTTRVVPTQAAINRDVLSRSDYTSFSQNLESAHNTVHMFVGGNTMPNPAVSPRDPLFFLHHANVDRIWAQWQETPGRPEAPLTGTDAWMTPFTNYHVSETRDTFDFGYYYE